MANTFKIITRDVAPASAGTPEAIYTVQTGSTIVMLGLTLSNVHTAQVTASVTLESTTKGFLPPRNADPATNIATPAEGLIAFDTTDKKLQVYDGTNWIDLH